MPWVKFLDDFDWKPTPAVTVAYRSGMSSLVTTACGRAAIAKGKAERTSKPRGGDDGQTASD